MLTCMCVCDNACKICILDSFHSDSAATPTMGNRPMRTADSGHMTPNPLLQKLQSQVARLEYENAKLKVDLQNR